MAPPGNASANGAQNTVYQNADIARGHRLLPQQRCERGYAFELECYGGANANRTADSQRLRQHSIPLEELPLT